MIAPALRLLIVDDHPVVLAGLRTIAECADDIQVVGEARNIADAIATATRLQPDVALLDIRLTGESGIDLCRKLKSLLPHIRILMVTSFVDGPTVLSALEAGADGYLLKENDTMRLVNAIREVARGETVLDAAMMKRVAESKTSHAGPPLDSGALNALSLQERRLLAHISQGKTDKEAAAALGLTPKTARNYLDRIFAKLNVHTRTEAATLYIRSESGR
jgi:two-component system, NarL family, response regulator DevR